jgi:hypothetical protein
MERMTILHSVFRNFAVILVVAGFGLTMAKLPINPWLSGVSCALGVVALMTWAEAKSEPSRNRRKKPTRVRACPAVSEWTGRPAPPTVRHRSSPMSGQPIVVKAGRMLAATDRKIVLFRDVLAARLAKPTSRREMNSLKIGG